MVQSGGERSCPGANGWRCLVRLGAQKLVAEALRLNKQRSRSSKILFWVAMAPALFYGVLTIAIAIPSLFLGPSAEWQPPAFLHVAFKVYTYLAAGFSALLVWWCWRAFCGDPPRNPKTPSRRALVWGGIAIAVWVLLILLLNIFTTETSSA